MKEVNQIKSNKLIVKLIENTINENEAEELNAWLQNEDNLNYFNEFIETTHLINTKQEFLYNDSLNSVLKSINKKKNKLNYWKYGVAASIVLLISLTFIFNKSNTEIVEPIIVNNNIKAGTYKATLTLEDGTDIILEKGQSYIASNIASNGEEIIYNNTSTTKPEIAYNYLTIPRGGQYFVKLSDGTQVWLNSESKLKYPVSFIEGETREVELVYGEAYFDVSPSIENKGSKFKVFNNYQEVEVLGTEFNIKAYKGETNIYTTLVEGGVALKTNINETILIPEEQFVLNTNNKSFHVSKVNVYDAVSWKNGVFSFRNTSLIDITKVLTRWYDVDFIFTNKDIQDAKFIGVLSKKQSLEEILLTIKNTEFITSYNINGKTIILN